MGTRARGSRMRGRSSQFTLSKQAKVSRRLLGVVRPNPAPAPITIGREFLPARGMGPSIQSGRRYPTRRSTVVVSCPLPPGVSFRDLQTSDSLRYAPNRFLTSSRAGRLPPSWSSPVGGLGGRLVHCWPTYVTGTRRKPVRTTTGPPSSERPPPSRKK
ncbi:conserved hypothetical protein [Trichinella spiralis]|uniref:hypothetical protein n=1 Tax=Trichinella spiralis TaxID=6334 RepID=UPI0001EFE81D|nr:conserved hypothetical protein [Trichinella spiralis]